ncbi:MAG: NADH-quinone oxidoreductase subunit N [Calditrichaeota bacterium]|nr:NADH-quinone oxidoreductase subunit N [Calditrichota bacterium]
MFDSLIADMHVSRLIPEIFVIGLALVAILVDVVLPRGRSTRGVQITVLIGLFAVIAATVLGKENTGEAFGGMVVVDGFTFFFRLLLAIITFLVVLVSEHYIERLNIRIAEYYLLLLFSLFGMLLMAMAQDLLIVFLGIETMSVSLYALVGLSRQKHTSNEGAIKYFLLGAFTTAIFVYGIALMFGVVGSTNINDIVTFLSGLGDSMPLLAWAGAGLILIGFGFKAALVPFHWWSPDAYEGAPTTITAFMSTAPKAAAFAAFLRVFYIAFGEMWGEWTVVLWWIAVLTMTFGNLLALRQDSVKRMLAFSSITHAGYLVIALLTFDRIGAAAMLFYLVVYALMNLGAFLIAIAVNRDESEEKGYWFDDYKGLVFRKPALALAMLVFMLALAGIPPTAGFFGKYYIFASAVNAGFVGLAVIGVLNSAVSVYYYLRLVVYMFLRDREAREREGPLWITDEITNVVFLCLVLVLLVGLFPDALLTFATNSVKMLL